MAGPASRNAIGRTSWSSAFACAEPLGGRTSGTTASKAGEKNAVAGAVDGDEPADLPQLQRRR